MAEGRKVRHKLTLPKSSIWSKAKLFTNRCIRTDKGDPMFDKTERKKYPRYLLGTLISQIELLEKKVEILEEMSKNKNLTQTNEDFVSSSSAFSIEASIDSTYITKQNSTNFFKILSTSENYPICTLAHDKEKRQILLDCQTKKDERRICFVKFENSPEQAEVIGRTICHLLGVFPNRENDSKQIK